MLNVAAKFAVRTSPHGRARHLLAPAQSLTANEIAPFISAKNYGRAVAQKILMYSHILPTVAVAFLTGQTIISVCCSDRLALIVHVHSQTIGSNGGVEFSKPIISSKNPRRKNIISSHTLDRVLINFLLCLLSSQQHCRRYKTPSIVKWAVANPTPCNTSRNKQKEKGNTHEKQQKHIYATPLQSQLLQKK